jgi:nucleoside-diphosphate-sugar epimerase
MVASLSLDRRDALYLGSGALAGAALVTRKPICVIGANGETGRECVRLLATTYQQPVRAVSRKHDQLIDVNTGLVENVAIDIRDDKAVSSVLQDTSACIFLANAKKTYRYIKSDAEDFQNFEDIDVYALQNVVHSCIKHNVPRLVFVSASCRSCMISDDEISQIDIDKISGISCENCRSKQIGENIIKKRYKIANKAGVDYTIVRVGYLFNGEDRGPKEIEINQDYTKSGMISRTDLANICINTIENPSTSGCTFEAYYRDTTQPYDVKESLNRCMILGKSVEECFFGSSFKDSKPKNLEEVRKAPIRGSLFTTGNEFNGNSWNKLFTGLQKDN